MDRYGYSKIDRNLKLSNQMGSNSLIGITLLREEHVVVLKPQRILFTSPCRSMGWFTVPRLSKMRRDPTVPERTSTLPMENWKDSLEGYLCHYSSVKLSKHVLKTSRVQGLV